MSRFLFVAALLAGLAATPAAAGPGPVAAGTPAPAAATVAADAGTPCPAAPCQLRFTPPQLLSAIERLVVERRYAEARGLIAVLRLAPGFALQTRFLTGYMAAQEGDHAAAAGAYKAILADDPGQTRVRLELGRAMLALGQAAAADRQLRLAQQSRELDPDLARLVRGARQVIRSSRAFRADVSIGLAPDSNINNATDARTVNVRLGDVELPLSLNEDARARSGTGVTAVGAMAGRLPVAADLFLLGNLDASGTNYPGRRFDDYLVQGALGGDVQLSNSVSASLQAVAAQRWFGGAIASRQLGMRGGAQVALDDVRRLGVQLDVRRTRSDFDRGFGGWQGGLYASYETGLGRSAIAAAQAFVRRDWLNADALSNVEVGGGATLAGELPFGINYSFGGTVSRALFDAPQPIFSADPRRDWRLISHASLGYRKIRLFGFSPQVAWQASRIDSSIGFYRATRNRVTLTVARYF
ncbi:hypothetical protein ASG29_14195 [Sphingomonas sp. Leaf412]|uniref:surface lipoprotein assembly modifier n=1 Tax=Sphingomonas sp. Leaf412 TaxID=1736370 RepID=UPI0006FD230D|nr:surface lipoprotein assembly modifier [Sphingomonas sp. Leaf412]KQT32837.1 hypothetical protein ASG29_14195 [Sphingomonas sp. Leaf412]